MEQTGPKPGKESPAEEYLQLNGTIEGVIYSNDGNGYAVADLAPEGKHKSSDIVTIQGILPFIHEGDEVTVYGKWVHSPKYGRQFRVEQWERTLPSGKSAILRYLSARAIHGIGPKTAKRIVDEFGEETFDVIENHPDWLATIPGISPKRAAEISQDYIEKIGIHSAMLFFREFFGATLSVKIYKEWGGEAVARAKENPFRLCNEIPNVSFEKADAIARKLGFPEDWEERVKAGVLYILSSNALVNGHVCLPREKLRDTAVKLLGVSGEKIEEAIDELLREDKACSVLMAGISYIYGRESYEAERFIADKLVSLDRYCAALDISDIHAFIAASERNAAIQYEDLQKQAIRDALQSGVMILTGGPGTGKTTVVRALLDIFESLSIKVALGAPTGRAAKRLSESTQREAKTIHRLLEMSYDGGDEDHQAVFRRNETDLLDENVIIVDEASMIDQFLMCALLKAVKPGSRIILIGDSDQLPSVGPGNVLCDLIDSHRFSMVRLNKIFRQAQESLIVLNAHAINEGEMPALDVRDNDFFFLARETPAQIVATVSDLCSTRLPRSYGKMGETGVQIISPSRKGEAGTENLNIVLQKVLNPRENGKREYVFRDRVFREGDKVMQTQNNYELEWEKDGGITGNGIFNGDIGIIEKVNFGSECLEILFDDRHVAYDFSLLEDLDHAYAITVHKSQGSEYPIVILPLFQAPPMLLTRNLLYTAVTRARSLVILVGRKDVLRTMIDNNRQTMRYTGLCRRLAKPDKG